MSMYSTRGWKLVVDQRQESKSAAARRRSERRRPPESDAPKQLEDREDDVVHVAESGRLPLFGVMQSSSPVDRSVGLTRVESLSSIWVDAGMGGNGQLRSPNSPSRGGRRNRGHVLIDPPAEIWQNSNSPSKLGQSSPVKTTETRFRRRGGSVLRTICRLGALSLDPPKQALLTVGRLCDRVRTSRSVSCHLLDCFWGDAFEELDVLVRVELGHLLVGCSRRTLQGKMSDWSAQHTKHEPLHTALREKRARGRVR